MKVLFADYSTPEQHAQKEIDNAKSQQVSNPGKRPWKDVFIEQCINSAIVAGIAALAGSWVDPWIALKAFGLTWLIEMRKYRRL